MVRCSSPKVPLRREIKVGQRVWALEKRNYASGELTEGVVKRILTSKPYHPRGIKVMLFTKGGSASGGEDGTVARVQRLIPPSPKLRRAGPSEKKIPVDLDMEGELR